MFCDLNEEVLFISKLVEVISSFHNRSLIHKWGCKRVDLNLKIYIYQVIISSYQINANIKCLWIINSDMYLITKIYITNLNNVYYNKNVYTLFKLRNNKCDIKI